MSCPFDDFFGDAKGPFDASYEQGKRDEEIVKDHIESLGLQVRWATDDEDRLGKCDFFWRTTASEKWSGVDVKGLKPGGTIVEHQGITGHPGWLHGKARQIAFRTSKSEFAWVDRKAFVKFVYLKLGQPPKPAPKGRNSAMPEGKWFSRHNRDDVIARVSSEFFDEFDEYARGIGQDWWISKLG